MSTARKILYMLVRSQRVLSQAFDRLLPSWMRTDGNRDYIDSFVPGHIRPGLTIYDVGGGKSPLIDAEMKNRMDIKLVGIDIDQAELDLAPLGNYDQAICADICSYEGAADADIIICQAVLEHVPDVAAALRSMHSILRPGGNALLFTPSKNAVFARLNRILPERLKKAVLFGTSPETKEKQGFPAYYDRCTPNDFREMARECGLVVAEERLYYVSSYFSVFFPAYLVWRLWMIIAILMERRQAAETFSMILHKPEQSLDR